MDEDRGPPTSWLRGAVLLAFAAGGVGGFVAKAGLEGGWSGSHTALLVVTGALLLVSNHLITLTFRKPEERIPLPGEVYGDRKRPSIGDLEGAELKGRVPFKASKGVVQREADPRMDKLHKALELLNHQLQRANVKLGLGELSNEGYQRVVSEIKERRAELEHRIAHHEMANGD